MVLVKKSSPFFHEEEEDQYRTTTGSLLDLQKRAHLARLNGVEFISAPFHHEYNSGSPSRKKQCLQDDLFRTRENKRAEQEELAFRHKNGTFHLIEDE